MAESSCRAASTQHYRKCQQKPVVSKPYPISDLIPRNWGSSNEKGESRHFMSDLHLWMQAWSNEGGLARTEIADGRVHGRKATARKEAQAQRKVAKATAGHAGRVAKQDTLQLRVLKAAMGTCMPWVKRKVRSMKKQLTMVMQCKRGVSVVRE